MSNKTKGLKFKVQFYDNDEDKPYYIKLGTRGSGIIYGTSDYIKQAIIETNVEFDRFTSDKEFFREYVEEEVEKMIQFHFRPGGLMSQIPEEERPTIEQVRRWGWRIEDPKYVEQEYKNL
tara:strand:+ start:115 stop:474 length:360 start_codon:yes stop_codon:yes gene_type:complete